MCYPIPGHITALYVFTVINIAILLNLTLVNANVIVMNDRNESLRDPIADFIADFGPMISKAGTWGHVIYTEPRTACKAIQPPPVYPINQTGGLGNRWIALIERGGGCTFEDKVLHAQDKGYVAAIIFNDESDQIFPMHGGANASRVNISSALIGLTDGRALRDECSNNTRYNLRITPDFSYTYGLATLVFAVFGTIIGVSFLGLILIGVCKWVRDIRRRNRNRLSKQHLKKIPIHKFKKGDPYDVCAICLDDYEEGDKLRVLPCNHAYHQPCIDPWLTRNKKTCPICKQKVIPGRNHDSDSETDSEAEDSSDSDSERAPLLRAARDNNNSDVRPRDDTFSRSGIPEQFRPPGGAWNHEDSENDSDSSVDPMASVHNHSSVEIHSEPDYRIRTRPPKRRGGLNTRYGLVNEQSDDSPSPFAAPPLRPRANRSWEFDPVTSRGHEAVVVDGAVGGGLISDDVTADVDDVAPPRDIEYADPALADSLEANIEVFRDPRTIPPVENLANYQVENQNGGTGARPKTQSRDTSGLLLAHKEPRQGGKHSKKTKKNRANTNTSKQGHDNDSYTDNAQAAPISSSIDDQPSADQTEGAVGAASASQEEDPPLPPIQGADALDVHVVRAPRRKKSKKRRRTDNDV